MKLGIPPLGADVATWAQDMRRWLGRTWDTLSFKEGTGKPAQNGILLWDTAGYPVVSRTDVFVRLQTTVSAPATAASAGVAGDFAQDASYIYVCTATNTWKRVAIATW